MHRFSPAAPSFGKPGQNFQGAPFWLPLLTLAMVFPLLWHGPSCGHDFGFHMQSWMEAAAQLRHGRWPHWAFSPAFNAGEPRFIFYPPLSWLLGAGLLLAFPASAVPALFTWVALTGAALGMYALARRFVAPVPAFLAATVYVANPYLLFTALERTAYAELLAAAWMPLLFRAALAARLRPTALAAPLALLWLTNAPAAVMGTYALVLLVALRVLFERGGERSRKALVQPVLRALAGLGLGLGLAAFYVLPAAWERRYVQVAMAIIPNMRVEDNFLFGHTGYGPHDQVLHTASLVAIALLGLTAFWLALARPQPLPAAEQRPALPHLYPVLLMMLPVVAALLWRGSLPLWHWLPELAFLQFPWRLLSVLGCVAGLAAALALRPLRLHPAVTVTLALAFAAGAAGLALPAFRQGCEVQELPAARVGRFATHHGVGGTDEYTPTTADNDQLRWDDPSWWLASSLNAPAPGTVPNPASTIPDYDQPPPLDQTVAGFAPMHLQLSLPQPEELVLNLRDYPAWRVTLNGDSKTPRLGRDDGLLALALPAGQDTVDIRWQTLPDVWAGDLVSLLSLAVFISLAWRSRRMGR